MTSKTKMTFAEKFMNSKRKCGFCKAKLMAYCQNQRS